MSITLVILAITLMILEAGDVTVAMALPILATVNSARAAMVPLSIEDIGSLGSTEKSANH